jgi:hypothetical protein
MKHLFKSVGRYPKASLKLLNLASKQAIVNPLFHVDETNFHTYVEALESNVINQTSLRTSVQLDSADRNNIWRFDPLNYK